MSDSRENIMPNTPNDDGTIMKNPETKPEIPTDFLNLRLFNKAYANSNKHMVLNT